MDNKLDAIQGLKSVRKIKGFKPTFECSNCKCKRYSPCGCTKKGKKENANG